nr:penicillin-binding protein [Deinococcus aerophilus]
MATMTRRHAPLLTLLLALGTLPALGQAEARVRLGAALPAHPWTSDPVAEGREVVVVYSHDCGDLGDLWAAVLDSGLPVRAVNAEGVPSPAPAGLNVWRGDDATAFARALKVSAYPTVLLVQEGRILNAWEGDFTGELE